MIATGRCEASPLLLGLMLALTSCDPIYGIQAAGVSDTPPDASCIVNALRRTAGVGEVRRQDRVEESWNVVGNGPGHGAQTLYVFYKVGPSPMQTATFDAVRYMDGRYHYSNSMLSIHQRIPEQEIHDAYPVMVRSAERVSRDCQLNIAATMTYQCIGHVCKADHPVAAR